MWEAFNAAQAVIDDNEEFVKDFRIAGGDSVLFPATYNELAGLVDDPFVYVKDFIYQSNLWGSRYDPVS